MPSKNVKDLSDDQLLEDLMYWTRVYRTEEKLKGDERAYYKKVVAEAHLRKLLK